MSFAGRYAGTDWRSKGRIGQVELLFYAAGSALLSYMIMHCCRHIDDAAAYVSRDLRPHGMRRTTIHAISSSLPELMIATALLFLYHDLDGFSAGIATTAGSAVFNAVVIPALVILASLKTGDSGRIVVEKKTLIRDALFLIVAESALIIFLGDTLLKWWMGLILVGVYVAYLLYSVPPRKKSRGISEKIETIRKRLPTKFQQFITFDFQSFFFGDKTYTFVSAAFVLLINGLLLAVACFALATIVVDSAQYLGAPPYLTAILFAATAASVPDAIIAMREVKSGHHRQAMANTFSGNMFDITFALGLPLLSYGLIFGDVSLSVTEGDATTMQMIRLVLLAITVLVMTTLLLHRRASRVPAFFFILIFFAWCGFIYYNAGIEAGWF